MLSNPSGKPQNLYFMFCLLNKQKHFLKPDQGVTFSLKGHGRSSLFFMSLNSKSLNSKSTCRDLRGPVPTAQKAFKNIYKTY